MKMTAVARPFTPKERPKDFYKKGSTMTYKQVMEDREKYNFRTSVRPSSAPNRESREYLKFVLRDRVVPTSARSRTRFGHAATSDMICEDNVLNSQDHGKEPKTDDRDMYQLVKAAKEAKTFEEEAEFFRKLQRNIQEAEVSDGDRKDAAPVFNKRLFASQGAVIITREARRLMEQNVALNETCDVTKALSKSELQSLRCVVDGLKLIHKGFDFVKDVLSRVMTYEVYNAFEHVQTKSWEEQLGCYYILNGAVEVTYDLRATESRNVYQANIIYSHGTGEYLGLVSPEGPTEDLSPPATIYTKEMTQFIRIDRHRFHALMSLAREMINNRKLRYISSHSFLKDVSEEVKQKILHKLTIQEFPANKVLLSQNDVTENLFVIMKGRCQTYREVFIPEAERKVLFYLTSREQDDFFGEECVLDELPAICTVVTVTACTCMKVHRSALKMVNKEKLARYIDEARHENPSDQELRDRGYNDHIWNRYKHAEIKVTLKEGGNLRYLSRPHSAMVRDRQPSDSEMHEENMRRFLLKGSQFLPVRAKSAYCPRSNGNIRQSRRPKTAFVGLVTETTEDKTESFESNAQDSGQDAIDVVNAMNVPVKQTDSALISLDMAKDIDQRVEKVHRKSIVPLLQAMQSKERLMAALDEQNDVGSVISQAWRAEHAQDAQNFMRNGVMVTMTSEDIVRKAKALADSYADSWKKNKAVNDEEWDTILHAENKQAKMLITANKMRMKDLKRRLAEIQKKRERDRKRNAPRQHGEFSDTESD
ncbi:uncharacterized protein LOC127831039 isoform X2 [Dreissena polymorpha]|uniref:uncharacterized protein LOC127831039 isoform X2 n=1 Tax=Dreissena polymorpha TaxID=45954 RepID=UPI002263C861|nr:uncharacterized protein LOC127831039 isoform X2 [Dreissena polymorpha]